MRLKVIASGSKANAYILETKTGKLLLECGVNFKTIKEALGFITSDVQGLLLTHYHKDHSLGAKDALNSSIEVFTSKGTADYLSLSHHHRLHIVEAGKQFNVGDFVILPFLTEHDAEGSLGYLIYYKVTGEKLLFATDTYFIRNRFNGLNYILIECNYCKDTLDLNIEAGFIPLSMKNRLLESHFSLEHVKEFLAANDLSKVKLIVLLHLSGSNADANRMVREIEDLTGKIVVIAEAGKNIPLELYPF